MGKGVVLLPQLEVCHDHLKEGHLNLEKCFFFSFS